jgi:zinc and cadmium transporter
MTINLTIIASTIIACLAVSLCALSILFALWIKPDTLKSVVPYLVALAVGVRSEEHTSELQSLRWDL